MLLLVDDCEPRAEKGREPHHVRLARRLGEKPLQCASSIALFAAHRDDLVTRIVSNMKPPLSSDESTKSFEPVCDPIHKRGIRHFLHADCSFPKYFSLPQGVAKSRKRQTSADMRNGKLRSILVSKRVSQRKKGFLSCGFASSPKAIG